MGITIIGYFVTALIRHVKIICHDEKNTAKVE